MGTTLRGGFVCECNLFIKNKLREKLGLWTGRRGGGSEVLSFLSDICLYCWEAALGVDFELSTGYPQRKVAQGVNFLGSRSAKIRYKKDNGIA